MKDLSEEEKEFYYLKIKSFVMAENNYSYEDMDDEKSEDWVNRETDRIFEAIFEVEF